MYRPFLYIIVFFIPGVIIGSYLTVPEVFIGMVVLGVTGAVFVRDKKVKALCIGMVCFCIGAYYYNFRADRIVGTIVDYGDAQHTVVGKITDIPAVKPDKTVYDIDVMYVVRGEKHENATGKVRVSVPRDKNNYDIFQYGDVVKFSGKLKLPQGRRNPGGMDYKAYLMHKGVYCSVFTRQIYKIGVFNSNPLLKAAFFLRQRLTGFYDKVLNPDISALLTGVILGLKGGISGETLQAFSDSGVIHVLAVSGLHVGLIYGFLYRVFTAFAVSKIFSFVFGSLVIFFYSFMAGLSPSVIRAAIMVCVVMLGKIVGRNSDSINSLCLAAFILLLLNPLNVFTISFQLSFSAALGIILFYGIFKNRLGFLPEFISSSLAVIISAQLLVWPFTAFYFHKVSIIGFFTNLLVVPMVGFVLISGFAGGLLGLFIPSLGAFLVKFSGLLLVGIQKLVIMFSSIPGSTVVVPILSPIFIILYFAFLAVIFVRPAENTIKPIYKKVLAAIILLILIIIILPKNPDLEITFIDVGQGDAALIRTQKGKTVLIDGGGIPGYYNTDFDIGTDIVQPVLFGKGIKKINIMVFSHFDEDHAQGLLSLLRDMRVDTVVYGQKSLSELYDEMIKITEQKGIKTLQLSRGDKFIVDDITFEVLNPRKNQYSSNENDSSLVLRLNYKDFSVLFTGDLGVDAESDLLRSKVEVKADVLKVAHHGSSGSTSQAFLSSVKPAFAVISVGEGNNFGHPSSEVIKRLEHNGIGIYRTDIHGAVTFKIDGNNVKIFTTIPRER